VRPRTNGAGRVISRTWFQSPCLRNSERQRALQLATESEALPHKDYANSRKRRIPTAWLEKPPAKAPLAVWLQLEAGEPREEASARYWQHRGFRGQAGEGRAVGDEKGGRRNSRALLLLSNSKARENCPRCKLFQLLMGHVENIRTQHFIRIFLGRHQPSTMFADVIFFRQLTWRRGVPASWRILLQQLRPSARTGERAGARKRLRKD